MTSGECCGRRERRRRRKWQIPWRGCKGRKGRGQRTSRARALVNRIYVIGHDSPNARDRGCHGGPGAKEAAKKSGDGCKSVPQRLKPHLFSIVYVRAEARTLQRTEFFRSLRHKALKLKVFPRYKAADFSTASDRKIRGVFSGD